MKGSIRLAVGFLITFGAVGGLDTGGELLPCVILALSGLAIMFSGVTAMKGISQ